jgi:hypothetical protein
MLHTDEPKIPRYTSARRKSQNDFDDLPKTESALVDTKAKSSIKQDKIGKDTKKSR